MIFFFMYGLPAFLDKRCVGWYTKQPKMPALEREKDGIAFLYSLMDVFGFCFKLNSKYHKSCQQQSQDPHLKWTGALGPNISYPLRVFSELILL